MSTQPGLTFTKPGFLSLLQDGGRQGVMHLGLATGGAMDRNAWAWANRLLDNPFGTPALEQKYNAGLTESPGRSGALSIFRPATELPSVHRRLG